MTKTHSIPLRVIALTAIVSIHVMAQWPTVNVRIEKDPVDEMRKRRQEQREIRDDERKELEHQIKLRKAVMEEQERRARIAREQRERIAAIAKKNHEDDMKLFPAFFIAAYR